MRFMLDTNILIRAIRVADPALMRHLKAHIDGELCISAVTYMELMYGVRRSSNQERNLQAVKTILAGIRILPFDMAAADDAGEIMADLAVRGARIGDRDTLIAGHARSLGLILVTHNTGEFSRVPGLQIEDWLV